jgi:hypothetical protein
MLVHAAFLVKAPVVCTCWGIPDTTHTWVVGTHNSGHSSREHQQRHATRAEEEEEEEEEECTGLSFAQINVQSVFFVSQGHKCPRVRYQVKV